MFIMLILHLINMDNNHSPVVFRHNFSENIMKHLYDFAKIHQYDSRADYKDAWSEWTDQHNIDICNEHKRLKENGFNGDIYDKMYKSARYYFRKKKDYGERKKELTNRKNYVALDNEFLQKMDIHMERHCQGEKPSIAFESFCIMYEEDIDAEERRMEEDYKMGKEEFLKKIKKTYKNRHFQNISKK